MRIIVYNDGIKLHAISETHCKSVLEIICPVDIYEGVLGEIDEEEFNKLTEYQKCVFLKQVAIEESLKCD